VKYPNQLKVIFKNHKYPINRPSIITKVIVNIKYGEGANV